MHPVPRFGLILPNRDVAMGLAEPGDLIALAEYAEATGAFSHVWVGDSLMAKPRLESLTLLAAIAARTSAVRLGVACMASLPSRDPFLLAYQWASLDRLSGGRLILQACIGDPADTPGPRAEYANTGIQPSERGDRLEENVHVMRRLWAETSVTFRGRFHAYESASVEPKPVQSPPPVWVASRPRSLAVAAKDAERSLRRVARLGDGWVATAKSSSDFALFRERIHGYAAEYGRDFAPLPHCHYYAIAIGSDREAALEQTKVYMDRYYGLDHSRTYIEGSTAIGSPDQCRDAIAAYAEAGATDVLLRFPPVETRAQIDRFVHEVLPLF